MRLYQLADDQETYGQQASYWLVVSNDLEDELAGPFATRDEAANWILEHASLAELADVIQHLTVS